MVKIGDQVSDRREILTGLPTGSVLSCILFLIYVNDLPNISSEFTPVLFADDTTLSFRGSCMEEVVLTSNAELVKFCEWTRANRLMVNTDKTFHIDISTRSFSPSNIYFDGALIENNSSGRFLGVLIDNKMNFKSHIDEVCKKVSRSIGILYHLKNYLQIPSLISIYYSLVYPYLNYCSLVWGGTYESLLIPLITLQKRCIRLITGSPYLAHTSPLFKKYNLLKLLDIFKFRLAVYAFKNKNNLELLYPRTHSYNTRFGDNLRPHFQRLTCTTHSFNFVLPNLWNSIPEEFKSLSSIASFKNHYKKFLVSAYED